MSKDKNIFIEPWVLEEGWRIEDFAKLKHPAYVISLKKLEENLRILNQVEKRTGAHILMALKGFSMFSTFPLARKYLSGTEASSVNEARLGFEEFGPDVHVFSPSYTTENMKEYLKYANHLVFNSLSQWQQFASFAKTSARRRKISFGIRVNLEHSEVETPMYDPSSKDSHFGVKIIDLGAADLVGLNGLHFHNLCELGAEALDRSLKVFEKKFGQYLSQMKWVNFGGGHHITRADYNLDLLCQLINDFKKRHPHLEVYLEPGEAIALNAGVLVGQVIDIKKSKTSKDIAVLNISATTHMPDVLEMPYLPSILGAKPLSANSTHNYRLVGPSCLTGDVIGEYSFPKELILGQKIVFLNMAIYTMVKNNTFNGVDLPDIMTLDHKGKLKLIKKFNYLDFKNRLS